MALEALLVLKEPLYAALKALLALAEPLALVRLLYAALIKLFAKY